jgi:predicted metalloprotease with PDZ domain
LPDALRRFSSLAAVCTVAAAAAAQNAPIRISVDAREAPRRIFHTSMTILVQPGTLALVYPKWIPGEHAPTGPIADVAGLKISAGGQTLAWRRDPIEMHIIRCEVPAGASSAEVQFDYLSPTESGNFTASPSSTAKLAIIDWHLMLLYPLGRPPAELLYAPSLRVPAGWKVGGSLVVAKQSPDEIEYEPVSLEKLVDTPMVCGAHYRDVDLTPGQKPEHHVDIVADGAAALDMHEDQIEHYKRLIAEAKALFGARHYDRYHFLLTLSDHISHFGLEHHECSDNRAYERFLIDEWKLDYGEGLLSHEYVHSWNGKYRRPLGLATQNYLQVMKDDLLWVYEGLTEYLGQVLAARSGLLTSDNYTEHLALVAARLARPGRTWRPLQDTAEAAQVLYPAPSSWSGWRRGVDFYDEGALLWLEVDVLIRQKTEGKKSLDDFCRAFFGGSDTGPVVKPYVFEDIVSGLNEVVAHDWKSFLLQRLSATDPKPPMGGIEAAGWKLVFNDEENEQMEDPGETDPPFDLSFSLGFTLKHDGVIADCWPGSPAYAAGVGPGMKLIAVNGRKWSPDVIRDALKAAKSSRDPIELLVENGDYYATHKVDYHDGERYPHLERVETRPDLLEAITSPRTTP